jgi:hypothetical protein
VKKRFGNQYPIHYALLKSAADCALPTTDWVQTEVGHNLRWNSDKIMRRSASDDKRIYHLSIVNGYLSFNLVKKMTIDE